jgi:hypothetical protein
MDNDEIQQTIVRPWRKPARRALADRPIEQVGRAADMSLYNTLTAGDGVGGCPGLTNIVEALQLSWMDYRRRPLLWSDPAVQAAVRRDLVAQMESIKAQHDFHLHTCLAADVALRLCEAIGQRLVVYKDGVAIGVAVACGLCEQVVEHYLCAPLRPTLRRELGLSHEQACDWKRKLLDAMSPYINTTAARLLRDDTGNMVKRPVQRDVVKSTTAHLLNENLLLIRAG